MNKNRSNLTQRVVLYGVGASAVTAATVLAGKGKSNHVIYSGPVNFSDNTIHFDLQNLTPPSSSFNSGDDFKMKSDCSKAKAKIKGEGKNSPQIAAAKGGDNAAAPSRNGSVGGRAYAFKFATNQIIGTQTFYPIAYFNYDGSGNWQPGQRGFLALRIIVDCNAYYGWADVTFNGYGCSGPAYTLNSYAYNSEPNESIKAGEIKEKGKHMAIPAPSCTPTPSPSLAAGAVTPTNSGSAVPAIALLVAGASGVLALKRRADSAAAK